MPTTEFFADFALFQMRVRSLIDADPVGATLFASVLAGQIAAPEPGGQPLLATVVDQGNVLAAALRITPHPMIVVLHPSTDAVGVLGELSSAVVTGGIPVVGFSGRRNTVDALAARWSAVTGSTPELRMSLRYHRLGTLVPPIGVPGATRPAAVDDPADVDLLARWWLAFARETGANAQAASATVPDPAAVELASARGQVVMLWCDGDRPVAAAGHSPVRDGGSRIAPVFTPPEFRRRGYAAAVTTAAVRSARQAGATEVTLFTDADYPPANAVYRTLGFEVIAEFAEYEIAGVSAVSA